MELRHLRYFLAVAEHASFTEAARSVHVTQSTLSHQIRQLEDQLGHALFERSARRVVRTAAGELFLGSVTRAMRELDHGLTLLQEVRGALDGRVAIGVTHTFNVSLVPECVAQFSRQHASVSVKVEEQSAQAIAAGLVDGRLELGISYRPQELGSFVFEPLFNEELQLIVGVDHPLARRKRVRISELHQLDMVLPSDQYQLRTLLDEAFAAAGTQPRVVAEMNSAAAVAALVERCGVAAVVSPLAVRCSDRLQLVPLVGPAPVRTFGLLWCKDQPRSVAALAFASIVRTVVGRMPTGIATAAA